MNHATVIYPDWRRLSENEDRGFDVMSNGSLTEPELYEVIASVDYPDDVKDDEVLGSLFERFNIGDHGGTSCRSMSIGDVVLVERNDFKAEGYICKPIGWDRIDDVSLFIRLALEHRRNNR
jgi:hypothetical protein